VLPAAQVAHPVQLVPPHCPYFAVGVQLEDEVAGFEEDVVLDVVLDFEDEEVVVGLIGEVVVVVGLTGVVVVLVLVGAVGDDVDEGGGVVPPPLHPTRVEETEMSSYQNVLASPPYDSQPK